MKEPRNAEQSAPSRPTNDGNAEGSTLSPLEYIATPCYSESTYSFEISSYAWLWMLPEWTIKNGVELVRIHSGRLVDWLRVNGTKNLWL